MHARGLGVVLWVALGCSGCTRQSQATPAPIAAEDARSGAGESVRPSAPVTAAAAAPTDQDARPPSELLTTGLEDDPSSFEGLCAATRSKDYPQGDRPTSEEKQRVRGLVSRHLYYGVGVAVDYVKARHAAFVEMEHGEHDLIGGDTILMMLYANGFGVTRDLDLATKIACTNGFAPAEFDGRVQHLQGLKRAPEARPFDYCDDITSGYMMGFCAGLEEERKAVKRDRALERLSKGWPAPHQDALQLLKLAAQGFFATRVDNEVDLSGTARGAMMTEEETTLRNDFLAALKRFERGELPRHDAPAAQAADAALNQLYQRVAASEPKYTTVTAAGIRTTERAWMRYRDAWLVFGKVRYPSVTPESWQAWLALARTQQLREFAPAQ